MTQSTIQGNGTIYIYIVQKKNKKFTNILTFFTFTFVVTFHDFGFGVFLQGAMNVFHAAGDSQLNVARRRGSDFTVVAKIIAFVVHHLYRFTFNQR